MHQHAAGGALATAMAVDLSLNESDLRHALSGRGCASPLRRCICQTQPAPSAYSTCSTLARTLHDVDGAHVLCGGRPGLCGDADWSPQRSALLSTLVASLADPSKIIVHVATKEPSVALETERWYGVEHGSRPLTREELESYGEAVRRGLTATDLGAPAENPFLPDAERLRLARPAWRDSEDKDAVRRAASAAPPRRRPPGRPRGGVTPDDPALEDALRDREFRPYADFLLHSMGLLTDGVRQGGAFESVKREHVLQADMHMYIHMHKCACACQDAGWCHRERPEGARPSG